MDAVLMCGGRGSRLGGDREKPLVEVGGTAMVERVRRALAGARSVDRVVAVVSLDAPATRAWAEAAERDADGALAVVEGTGEGYVADLGRGLDAAGTPAVTVVADLPLLAPALVDGATERAGRGNADGEADSLAVCVPAALKRALGASVDGAFVPADAADGSGGDGAAGTADDRDDRDDRDGRAGHGGSGDPGGRELSPTGLNVVGDGPDRRRLSWDARLAVNVNRPGDLALARRLAGEGSGGESGADGDRDGG